MFSRGKRLIAGRFAGQEGTGVGRERLGVVEGFEIELREPIAVLNCQSNEFRRALPRESSRGVP